MRYSIVRSYHRAEWCFRMCLLRKSKVFVSTFLWVMYTIGIQDKTSMRCTSCNDTQIRSSYAQPVRCVYTLCGASFSASREAEVVSGR